MSDIMGQAVAEAFDVAKSSQGGLTTAEASDRLAASQQKSRNPKADGAWGLLSVS
jgi:hypothetical protein